ncbi:MAG: hypothetical protein L0K86_07170 [Actinomycetia bacterium]|nr:hypothetical protein [Actinomycetes bacterium]
MILTIRVQRLLPYALALVIAGAGVAAPAGADPGSSEEGDVAERRPARAVVSQPIEKPPPRFQNLRRLAQKRLRSAADDTWLSGRAAAALVDEIAGVDAGARRQGRVKKKRMPRSVGKLYTLDGGAIGECSAFTVRDPKFPRKRSFVVTAGHCLVDRKSRDWVDFAEFYPKYYRGKQHPWWGNWDAKRFLTYNKWFYKGRWKYDIGVVKLERGAKRKQIVDYLGGNRLVYGAKPRDKRVRFIGYPAAGRYDGDFPYQCIGRAHGSRKRKWVTIMPCATREGASGGPWFKRMRNKHTGVVYAALSRGTIKGKRYITAPTFKKSLRRIAFKHKW